MKFIAWCFRQTFALQIFSFEYKLQISQKENECPCISICVIFAEKHHTISLDLHLLLVKSLVGWVAVLVEYLAF